ncbi:MAG TPA: phospholipase D-like domain-containing protein [Gemmatales bacterium]|nr:phospholipase D-like domain-containing protein [Gemmatales bacterium]
MAPWIAKPLAQWAIKLLKKRVGGGYLANSIWLMVFICSGFSGGYYGNHFFEKLWKYRKPIVEAIVKHLPFDIGGGGSTPVPASSGSVAVYFTQPGDKAMEPGNIAQKLAGYIDQTKESIDVCAFELDNKVIVDALVKAVNRGVHVRLVTETDYINESGVTALKAVNVPVVDDQRDGALMHNKFMIFDQKRLWTGSMNFTENCAYKNNNHGLYIENELLAQNYITKFKWMFEKHKFGGLPSKEDHIPNPKVTLTDGTPVENYFSTHDRPANYVMDVLGNTKKSIHFMAFSFTHDGIGQIMLDKAKAGLDVQGVFEKSQSTGSHSEYTRMHDAKLPVYLDGNSRNMHHKVIIIDGEIVVCGSFNFSKSANESNDENLLIIYNRAVAAQFEAEYQKVLGVAKAAQSTQ